MKIKLFILILICTSCTHIESKPTKVLFNIPPLVRSNIDEVVKAFGKLIFILSQPITKKVIVNTKKKDGGCLSDTIQTHEK